MSRADLGTALDELHKFLRGLEPSQEDLLTQTIARHIRDIIRLHELTIPRGNRTPYGQETPEDDDSNGKPTIVNLDCPGCDGVITLKITCQ